jgi:cyclophilin family peptidyl-prolyl cis-trans isomerase
MKKNWLVLVGCFLFLPAGCSGPVENPVVLIETSMGNIKAELFANKAPVTVQNFMQYVDDKFYDGTTFHRVIPSFMIQGGGMEPGLKEKSTRPPFRNESSNGLSNKRGTLAMARTPQPHSATAQFFINVVDNNNQLDRASSPDGVGYAVFGQVIEGMDVVDKIRRVETTVKNGHKDVPEEDVVIKSIRRVEAKKEK